MGGRRKAIGGLIALALAAGMAAPALPARAEDASREREVAAIIAGSDRTAAPVARNVDKLSFASLDADTADMSISDRGGWGIPLPSIRIPAGRALSALVVHVKLAPDADDLPAVATVALNGRLLASRTIRPGERSTIRAAVPDGLAATVNNIDVNVLTRERVDATGQPELRRISLLPESHAAFEAAGGITDFSDLPAAFASGVTLVLPEVMRGNDAQIAALSRLLSGMIPPAASITVRFGAVSATGPQIRVADRAPPGLKAPIPMDRHDARIRDAEGQTLFSGETLARLTVAQLLDDRGHPVVWIRPGTGFERLADLPAGAELSYGDVALFDAGSRAFAMHSRRERLVRIDHAGDFHPARWLDANRAWLVLGAWALVTALFGWLLRQTRRARREASPIKAKADIHA